MLSKADRVKGQGVGSAYAEHLELMHMLPNFDVRINSLRPANLVHVHSINLEFRIQAAFTRSPMLGSVHFLPETLDGSIRLPRFARHVFDWYIMNFYRRMDHLVTVNPLFADKLVSLGFAHERVHYIPNYVSADRFRPRSAAENAATRAHYGLTGDYLVVGAGQVQPRKGVDSFINVARSMPGAQFVWAGGFSFGQITDGYEKLKHTVDNPPKNVKFLGIIPRPEMARLYAAADVMFLPSHAELFPMTILEACSCGTPVLLRDLDIYDAILGDYPRAEDDAGFTRKLAALRGGQERDNAIAHARWVKETYSAQTVAEQWQKLYDHIISEAQA